MYNKWKIFYTNNMNEEDEHDAKAAQECSILISG